MSGDNDNNTLFISSVNEAIQSSISQNKILLIFLSDESNDSIEFGDQFLTNNNDLKQLLPNFILLKLIKNTQEFEFFSQVFHDLKIPSVYAIKGGAILDIIDNSSRELNLQSFNERVHKLLHSETTPNSLNNSNTTATTATTNTTTTNNNNNNNNDANETNKIPPKSVKKPTKKYSTLKEESAEISAQKYRESLLKQQKQAKEEKERILKLLELDKEERHKEAMKRKVSTSQVEAADEIENFKETLKENIRYNQHESDSEYIIQLKLFNGQSLKKTFPNTTTLSTVRDFINDNYPEYQSTPYYFFKPIDRITYTDIDELNKSLKDLKLNRSLIIIKPSDHYGSSSMEAKKNGFQNLSNQQSSISWLKSSIGSLFGSVFASPTVPSHAASSLHEGEPIDNIESLYSTPVVRSAETTRSSTPRPALVVFDSTNNFSIGGNNNNHNSSTNLNLIDTQNEKNPDDRLIYNGNLLDMEDDKNNNKNNIGNSITNNKNGSGHFTTIGEETASDST